MKETPAMSDAKEPHLMNHEADGITELDNQLPRWWVWLFVITCIFAVVYLVHYHVMKNGPLQVAMYDQEMAAAKKPEPAAAAAVGGDPAAASAAAAPEEPSNDSAVLASGKELFTRNCMVCHGPDGQGLIGPNLTDEYWIHGGTYADVKHTIVEGVPAKGMITWKNVLKADEIQNVASYVWSLRGTTPPNPKPPEGEKTSI
jgi:cytochrome c oxidase cbb3-type subunit 3